MKFGISPVLATKLSSKVVKVAIFATAVTGGVTLISSSVFASLSATAFNTAGQSVSVGTLKLTQAASGQTGLTGGFTTAISAMAPGDQVNRFIDLTQAGTLNAASMTFKVADANTTTLTTDATNGLQVTVKECTVAYTATTGACSGTETTALAKGSANALLTDKALTLIAADLTGGASNVAHLKIVVDLPAGSEVTTNGTLPVGTVQGVSSSLTWTFTEAQRTATTTQG
ncbi:MAG: TasA family protein [Actinomycetes bacterium]